MQNHRQKETQVDRNSWRKKTYKSWDDAFHALLPEIRQQSVRIAEYTQVLFRGACASDGCRQNEEAAPYLSEEYEDVAYKCGLYCQIGKAMLPTDYQIPKKTFTEQQRSWYELYPIDGEELVTRLQGDDGKHNPVSIPCLMIRKATAEHMERWNGSGFPNGKEGNETSLIAQLAGLAKELDRISSQTRSEDPFEDAVSVLLTGKDIYFSDVVLKVLKDCRAELRAIYKKYIQYTKALPRTIPLVDKRPNRPFGLSWHMPVTDGENGDAILEATAWYRETAKADPMDPEEAESFLRRTGIGKEVARYLLYEAADTAVRLNNIGHETDRVYLPLFALFYEEEQQSLLEQLWEDQGLNKKKLMLGVPEQILRSSDPEALARLSAYAEQGIPLVLDGYRPEYISVAQILEAGFTHVRPDPKILDKEIWKRTAEQMQYHGIRILKQSDSDVLLTEDELIRELLMNEA